MRRRPPRSTRTDTLFPYTTLFRSRRAVGMPLVAVSNVLPCFANWPVARLARLIPDVNSAESRPSTTRSARSEEHTSELQSLMRISYAVFCLKEKTLNYTTLHNIIQAQTYILNLTCASLSHNT